MWTKILILMITFFLVANPATFKIMRGVLGGWVASSEGLATPAGLVLHAAVFVGLAIFLPRALMGASGFAISKSRAAAIAAERNYNRERNAALKAERRLRAEGLSAYEDEPEEGYEDEEEFEDEAEEGYEDEDGEGYVMTQAQRKARFDRLAGVYNARRLKAEAKLKAEGLM